jgi:serine phosphatase RsbU (regulator of sigma subunit)/Tfp pilus assembly protein PilF
LSLFGFTTLSQGLQEKIDSLHNNYPKLENDTLRIKNLELLSRYYYQLDTTFSKDSSLATSKRAYDLVIKKENNSYSNFPYIQYSGLNLRVSNYDVALEVLLNYRDVARNIGNKKWESDALGRVVRVFETIKDKERSTQYIQELKEVTKNMERSLGKAEAFNDLGTYYKNNGVNDSALFYHDKALQIRIEENDSLSLAFSYNNIGLVYKNQEKYDEALEYYKKSLEIKEALKNIKGMAGTNINIGKLYLLKKDFSGGIPYVEKGIALTEEVNAKSFQLVGYSVLYELHREMDNFKASLLALEKVRELESEIQNEEQIELAKELERKYNAEKHEQEAKINALELENSKVTLSRQKSVIWFLGLGVFVFIVLIILVFINYRQKKKINQQLEENNVLLQEQKKKTENQNVLLARKNKEITDSINYAKRIQEAILPSRYTISESINNGFVLFKPKDVVSGDFYWMEEKNNKLFLAVADCTGHGVPGAMVSVICSNALSKALLEENIELPGKLLDRTRAIVINQFQKSSDHVKDGMDISLAVIDKKNNVIEWAGANNPLWIIRAEEKNKVEEFRPDKQPVGVYDKESPFTTHEIKVSENDKLYMFSDGFVDQFGGKMNKKFKPAQFRQLLLEIESLPMKEQKLALDGAFEKWRGKNEQVDDICIIGYEI